MPETQEDRPRTATNAPADHRPRRPHRLFVVAAFVALAGCGLLALRGPAGAEEAASANRALVDTAATTEVIGDVGNALTRIFSYDPDDTAATERAAADALSGRAAHDYRRLFPQVRRQAPAQRLALRTRVVRAGLVSLTGDTARLLVFLDQAATRAGRPAASPAAAQLSVTAHRHNGQWRITEISSR
ncbi:hypothetical protein ABZ801_34905 [Actinomadura sp. NPDC047616]|uniref:hypothetical protein n=1 Tax=Actinomadura sp. NPDC047616 TaxID=3155914 RepID=UPI0033FFC7FE